MRSRRSAILSRQLENDAAMGILTSVARNICLRHSATGRVTGFVPLGKIRKAVVLVDGSLPDAGKTVDAIHSFDGFAGRQVETVVLGWRGEPIKNATVVRPRDINFYGRVKRGRKYPRIHVGEELLVSLVSDPENFTATQISLSSEALFKIGRFHMPKEIFNIVVLGDEGGQLRAFGLVCDILKSVK